ncbi:hypothetical protein [Pontibacillus litoralis]|uniref:Uncharacterized protein n=1 Tax=Pontibacillus litoralis JSM 072002 TaxID=1385512 RepID=A0A0A5G674_9BACI|nr:hypothetical protein [Pontibacillus litoralis]KGX87514.1 hypothetical protein N784_14810 [Pontibacillus litoralis JSM 072002]
MKKSLTVIAIVLLLIVWFSFYFNSAIKDKNSSGKLIDWDSEVVNMSEEEKNMLEITKGSLANEAEVVFIREDKTYAIKPKDDSTIQTAVSDIIDGELDRESWEALVKDFTDMSLNYYGILGEGYTIEFYSNDDVKLIEVSNGSLVYSKFE